MEYKIVSKNINGELRYIINNIEGLMIDDAQGYGYKTSQNAYKALWYKFKGGEKKINNSKSIFKDWVRENKEAYKRYEELVEINFKEIYRGETTMDEIFKDIEEEFNISIDKNIRKLM